MAGKLADKPSCLVSLAATGDVGRNLLEGVGEALPTFPAPLNFLLSSRLAAPTEVYVLHPGQPRLQDLLPPLLRVGLGLLASRGGVGPTGRDAPGAGQVVAAAAHPAAPVPRVAAHVLR